ncbi:vesicle-associated protein 2-2-like isoform X2 [Prosopis cineraria]|uniref:vesicle-associated protein 2-2-like isoform X2 n=1 Tax=Prosopis cineraria TaxID=364024 RepID=UPI00241085D2|nr:vesicle-associated protein 2-2-like isoform X2 [Prosopis cineraria]
MSEGLLQIEPTELKFTFELKKQSSCSVQLTNSTHHYVAFKIKTTSPKKYSVRPHVGVLMPKSSCVFVVLVDLMCKDKFLIQSTIVPVGTTNDDITSSLFVKDASRCIEEEKLKVTLVSPFHSAEASPVNGDIKNGPAHGNDKIFSEDEIVSPEHMVVKNAENKVYNEELKHEKDMKLKPAKDKVFDPVKDVEQQKPDQAALEVSKDLELNVAKDVEELKSEKAAESRISKGAEELELMESIEKLEVSKDLNFSTAMNVEELVSEKEAKLKVPKGVEELKLMASIEELKLKLDEFESKLNEAGVTISKLTEERMASSLETKILQEKLADLLKKDARKVKVEFPLLHVCVVALICVFLGYRLHP